MSDFENAFKDLLGRFATKNGYVGDLAEVVSYEQDERADGYCDTCYYEYTVVEVTYIDTKGIKDTFDISMDMSDLVKALARFDLEERGEL